MTPAPPGAVVTLPSFCYRSTLGCMAETPTTVRLNPPTRDAIKAFAASMGISFNAALSVLISEALTARGLHPNQS